ncbi:MAG TPA: dihydrolipoamide acetyltransferase family protein [Mycobacteriales bacterium]|nr:dihydrolipoamide acetyltransferase family protein [Mycobacteriales bacterium]
MKGVGGLKQFTLPDVGEGLVEGDILAWRVKAGDEVHDGQIVVEVETAKAAVELPCPFDGVVQEIHAAEGSTVEVGAPLLTVQTQSNGAAEEPERQPNLVGYGPRARSATRRPRRPAANAEPSGAVEPVVRPEPATRTAVQAKPPVRKLAKDLGVDLAALHGSGADGIITRSDVESAAHRPAAEPVERIAVKGVHKHMAAAMVSSAFTAPHASEFLTLDITPTMELRERIAGRREFSGIKVSPLLFVAKALLLAVGRHPMVNSSWDAEHEEIVLKREVNLGIAAATDRGLVVPNIKAADQLSLPDLARALNSLTETARAGKTSPADLAGGTISITNVGVFGIDSGTPILPPGETMILAFGAVRDMPWVVEGQIVPRKVTQLSISFDHRVIDGAQASAFFADIGALLSDPALAMTY